jgi:selenocysteine lyase/cysteine desulfurase
MGDLRASPRIDNAAGGEPMIEPTSRRSFLFQTGRAALAPTVAASVAEVSALLAATPPNGEDYWRMVRRQFAFSDSHVPMNAANLCPAPQIVADQVAALTRDIDLDCSFQNRAKFAALLETSRQKVAEHLGVTGDEIALVRNTSEANNTINNGLALEQGDEVVLWDQNHPTNNVAWDVRAARFGLRVRRVATPAKPADDGQLVQIFTDAFTPRTRALALTHVSNTSGLRLPIRELCAAAHQRGIFVHVDGAQSWGALDVNLRELDCDSYSASAHKWFVGPKEVGLLYVRKERIGDVWPNVVAPGWGTKVEPEVKGARKFESLGQRDDAALAAIATAVDFHLTLGLPRVEARIVELATALKLGVKEAGLELVTPLDAPLSGGVCVIRVPADRTQEIYNRLYSEHGIAGAATGGLRLCPHVYNTRDHIERAVRGVKTLLANG